MTGDITGTVFGLQPNQEYTGYVTAVGSSCASDPAMKNFMVQASDSMTATSKSIIHEYTQVGSHMPCMEGGITLLNKNCPLCVTVQNHVIN